MFNKCKHVINMRTEIDCSDKMLPMCIIVYWECESCEKVFSLQDVQDFINSGSDTKH